jgi:hypothetical protein
MKAKIVMFAIVIASLFSFIPFANTAKAQTDPTQNIPVTGTFGKAGTFKGNYDIVKFVVNNGKLYSVGYLTGTLRNGAGTVVGRISNKKVLLPVTDLSSTCEILHLELGPVDLNLLGLKVHLDKIVLDISATAAPGNLLGNLLCSLAHLLDSGGSLSQIANLLNQILAVLGGL